MRNWNFRVEEWQTGLRIMLRAYLWGIETGNGVYWCACRCKLRAYLWGIETLFFCICKLFLALLRAYLWGIETNIPYQCLTNSVLVASLPMRNWNCPGKLYILKKALCCEPTYEELKPVQPKKIAEPKLSCEPTYEELKHERIKEILFEFEVASLPMRNWNWELIQFCRRDYCVASLPMRNWNPQGHFHIRLYIFCCEPTYEELKLQ